MLESKKNRYIIVIAMILVVILFKKLFINDIVLEKEGFNDNFIEDENISSSENKNNDKVESKDQEYGDLEEEDRNEDVILDEIYIHISGQVKIPGIYKLMTNDRVIDAINLAGGLLEEADLDRINLAKKLLDEDKIYIPSVGEVVDSSIEDINNISSANSKSASSNSKININTCTQKDLESLPGIGEKTADKIIEYRKQNTFIEIEDIMEVKGIGQKKFEEISQYIITK